MIQRIQSVYMLLAGIAGILMATVFALWYSTDGTYMAVDNPVYLFFAGLAGGILLANVFNFKKRKLQVVINRIALVLLLLLAGFMIYEYVMLLRADGDVKPGIGLATPLVAIVLVVLANRAIIKDEELVRSADRFR
jgi:peptidoglycan/LPS O-acetylase OafA/YrhL